MTHVETLSDEIQHENRRQYELEKQEMKHYNLENNIGICRRFGNCFCQPFKVLLRIRENDVIKWLAVVSFFTLLPESGIRDIMASYLIYMLNDKYFDSNKSKETYFNSMSMSILGIAMLISQIILLPILNKIFNKNDIILFAIGIIILLIWCFFFFYLYLNPNIYIGYLIRILFGCSTIVSSIITGALSKRLTKKEQGLGIGILQAVKGITFTISPFIFAILFRCFENNGILVTMPFMVGFIFILMAFPILFGPVKRVLNQFDDMKIIKQRQANIAIDD